MVTIRMNLTANGKGIAYSVPLFGSISEAQSGTRETFHDLTEVGMEDISGCGCLWQF